MIYELKGIKLNFLLSFLGRVFILFGLCITIVKAGNNKNSIYHNSWIDFNKNGRKDPYENQELSNEKRIEDLLKRMTLEEKTCQMATLYGYGNVLDDELPTSEWKQRIWKDGIANIDEHLNNEEPTQHAWPPSRHAKAINKVQRFFVEETRLGIPVDFTNEGIQGLRHSKTTTFPSQPGVGSTWDLELVNEIGHIVGKEAKALGYTNVYAPIMDIARDPRWGRTTECYTEDTYLASQMGIQMVRALQSEGVVSTPKHFAVYSIPEGGRDGDARANPGAPWREVLTIHLPPFKATIKEAGAMGIMNSYNDYDGIPLAANKKFITEILRNEWGFKGYVISDSWSVEELYGRDSPEGRIRGRKHHVAPTYRDAVRQAVEAGINVRCAFNEPEVYIEPLRELVKDGVIPMELINKRVEDVLRVKFWLGLFNNPYISNPEHSNKIVHTRETRKVSLKAARKSIILLKNEENLLPIDKDVNSILVAGPNAKATSQLLSDYGPKDLEVISVFEGIKEKVSSNTKVKYIKGCKVTDKRFPESDILYEPPSGTVKEKIKKAAELAKKVDIAVVVLGENSNGDHETVSESYSRLNLNLPGYQRDLIKAIYSSGTPTVAVLLNGRPLTINWIDKNVPAILEAWFPGEYTGQAIADVIFGDYNPGGKLPMTFPKFVGQVPMTFPHKISSQNDDSDSRVGGVLYPFGHGLSYTEFEYKDLSITPIVQEQGANIEISFNVKNIGNLKGDEVVQLYLRDIFSSVTPYEKVLRGFKRVTLRPAEKKNIKFTIEPEDMKIVDRNMNWVVEPGEYRIMIGSSSEDIRLMDKFEIVN